MNEERMFKKVLDCAFKVHSALGPGLFESTYEECLSHELVQQQIFLERQVILPVVYKGITLKTAYRIDLLIEKKIIVEIKAVESFADIHLSQILTYMKLSGCRLGLLVNFNVQHLRQGIKRVVL